MRGHCFILPSYVMLELYKVKYNLYYDLLYYIVFPLLFPILVMSRDPTLPGGSYQKLKVTMQTEDRRRIETEVKESTETTTHCHDDNPHDCCCNSLFSIS